MVPELKGDMDTQYFDVLDDDKDKVETFATPRVSVQWGKDRLFNIIHV